MKGIAGGYSIVEVMVVLAVSVIILLGAIGIFSGKQNETGFNQAVQDLASTIQNYGAQINAGTFPESDNYTCTISGTNRPLLTSSGAANSTQGSRQDCIFLGRAFQVISNNSDIEAYTIIGTRNKNGQAGAPAATNISEANPEPAIDGSGNWLLYDDYLLSGSANIKSSAVYDAGGTALSGGYMLGLYTSLLPTNTSVGATTTGYSRMDLAGYSLDSATSSLGFKTNSIKTCIEGSSCSSNPVSQWKLCLQDGGAVRTAQLVVKSAPSGVSVIINDVSC